MEQEVKTPKKRSSCLIKGLVILLVIALGAGIFIWWHNRPIKPVELTQEEKEVVVDKVQAIQAAEPGVSDAAIEEAEYQPGSKEIVLSERELNGLLNEQTSLGDKLRFELVNDAIHARVDTDLDPDLPLVGGKRLKLKARFLLTHDDEGAHFVIDDVTVWGISLPNDWLGGLKGRDLIAESMGAGNGLAGVESIKVTRGEILIKLKE